MPDPSSPLASLFAPSSVAVIGASDRPGSVGGIVLANLAELGFAGPVFPVHPRADVIGGLPAFANVTDLPQVPESAIVCLPAPKVADALRELAAAGVPSAVVVASGYAESGPVGVELQEELAEIAHSSGMVVCGPNCLGVFSPASGQALYTAPLPPMRAGRIGLIAQSGTAAILMSNLGRFDFSSVISVGNEAVVGVAEVIRHLATDETTDVIACYLESIRDGEAFAESVRAAREAGKQVVVLRVGRSASGSAASAAHTASLITDSEIYDRFLTRHGVLQVRDFDEFVELVALLDAGIGHVDGDVALVGISGGANVLLCDLAEETGLPLPALEGELVRRWTADLPGLTPMNPVDAGFYMFDDAAHRRILTELTHAAGVGLVVVSQDLPAGLGDAEAAIYRQIAQRIADVAGDTPVPVVCLTTVSAGLRPDVAAPLQIAGVPILQGARAGLAALAQVARARTVQSRAATPEDPHPAWVERLSTGHPLNEDESMAFLSDHGIGAAGRTAAPTAAAAAAAAEKMAGPVAIKVLSADIAHKSDVGGVLLGIRGGDEAAAAFDTVIARVRAAAPQARIDGVLVQEMLDPGVEIIVGTRTGDAVADSIVVGAGGIMTELLARTALDVLPSPDVLGMLERSGLAPVLAGFRGSAPADAEALTAAVTRLAAVARIYRTWIDVIEINPLIVGRDLTGARAADALVVLRKQ